MSDRVAIEVRDLRKVYPARSGEDSTAVVAVDGVSFAIDEGESLGLIGESGSGKTTIARILAGLDRPTSGSAVVFGEERPSHRRASVRREWARRLQIVFQNPYSSLDPRQSVSDCIEEVLALHWNLPARSRRDRVAELLDQVGLRATVAAALPRDLSGGQRQRVAIARSLAAEPNILVLDEPVSALDVSVQAQVLNLISDLRHQRPITYLFVSHDLAVVRQVTERCVVLRAGRVVESGPTEDVLQSPTDPYTRELKESVPVRGWKPRHI